MFFRFIFILLVSMVALSWCQDEKIGFCPMVNPGSSRICTNLCVSDNHCYGDLKCCPTSCGGSQCVEAIRPLPSQGKPGTCPANDPDSAGVCIVQCNNDYECKGDLKCCKNPCGGGVCVKSVEASQLEEKHGFCPASSPDLTGTCDYFCNSDSSCNGHLKCCRTSCGTACLEPLQVKPSPEKPGTCPANGFDTAGTCRFECDNDFECRADLKCCKNTCGGGVCVKSAEASVTEEKPGTCPKYASAIRGVCTHECANDFQCGGDLKCCKKPCGGSFCTSTVEHTQALENPGFCPAITSDSNGICGDFCRSDSSCNGYLKCCPTSCGKSCLEPLKDRPLPGE